LITLDHVSRVFRSGGQEIRAVDDISFEVADGELCVLIGPSGSGKTTTMRMINRLETASEGTIAIDGRDITSLDVVELRRHIGYVIQQGGLFPHFTVAENVAVVPRLLGWKKGRRRERAEELLDLVGLDPALFADRYPRQLSGGQQQRVGVARALAADAPIILMDEPFGAVDPITRKQLQRWLRQVQAEVHKTIVFVTHDINEAFLLGDRIVLMNNGAIEQNGTPAELLREPASDFVREFIGDEFALQALEYTRIAELAQPVTGVNVPHDGIVISGELSVPEASRELTQTENTGGEGFWVSNGDGEPSGFVSYQDLATALGEGIAADPELVASGQAVTPEPREADREEVDDAVSAR
jgi:osmoprotectant transport system ATP-binding protein